MVAKSRKPGELEALVMNALWQSGGACSGIDVQQLLAGSANHGDLALTTVLTVLQRLTDKGMVVKVAAGRRSVRFQAALTREEHSAQALLGILEAESDSELTLTHFVGSLSEQQRDVLAKALRNEG